MPRKRQADVEKELNNFTRKWAPRLLDYAWVKVKPHLVTWLTLGVNHVLRFAILKLGPTYGPIAMGLLGLAAGSGVVAGEVTDTFEPVTWVNEGVLEPLGVAVGPAGQPANPLGTVDTPESLGVICDGATILPLVLFENMVVNKHPTAVFAIEVKGSSSTSVEVGELIVENVSAPNVRIVDSTFRTVTINGVIAEYTFAPSLGSTTAPLFVGAGDGFSNNVGTADHLVVDGNLASCFIQKLVFRNIEVHGGAVSFDDMVVNKATFTNITAGDTINDPDFTFGSDNTVGSASTTALDDTQDVRID